MVTTLYAGILALIYIVLTAIVIAGRFKHRVGIGDGGNEEVFKRIRMHSNFAEYVPLALVLMFLAEFEGAAEWLMHVLGAGLVIGRLAHAFGLYGSMYISKGRSAGTVITLLVILVAAILCIQSFVIL